MSDPFRPSWLTEDEWREDVAEVGEEYPSAQKWMDRDAAHLKLADRLAQLVWLDHEDWCAVTYELDEDHFATPCDEAMHHAARAYLAARANP